MPNTSTGSAQRPRLAPLIDAFIVLLARAQEPDGYIYTYNQIHFPGTRWVNLQIEHELYCHGHLIEAGVSRYEATGRTDLLDIARRAADCIVANFKRSPLVYCLESTDNPDVDIFEAKLSLSMLAETFDPDLLGGAMKITVKTTDDKALTFIPYHLWGNRGSSQMNVWVNT